MIVRGRRAGAAGVSVALVHLTFEGVQTVAGGVGTVIGDHLASMPLLREVFAAEGVDVTPYFFDIAYGPQKNGYDADHLARFTERLAQAGGHLGFLANGTRGGNPGSVWGNPELGTLHHWQIACAGGATAAINVGREHDVTIVYGHDTVFALAPMYATLQAHCVGADLYAIYVAHATALTHERDDPNPERLMAESSAVHFAKSEPRAPLGGISRFMREHLVTDYGATPDSIVPTVSGVYPRDPWFRQRTDAEIAGVLTSYGIPVDRPLLVGSGRAVAYKRHEQVLDVAARLGGEVHAVVQTYSADEALVQPAEGQDGATVVAVSDRELFACLCQWHRTRVLLLPAAGEPFGLLPSEARLLARDGGCVVAAADSGGFSEQIRHGADGFLFPVDEPAAASEVVAGVLALDDASLGAIRTAGARRVLGQYSVPQQVTRTVSSVVPDLADACSGAERALDDRLRLVP